MSIHRYKYEDISDSKYICIGKCFLISIEVKVQVIAVDWQRDINVSYLSLYLSTSASARWRHVSSTQ